MKLLTNTILSSVIQIIVFLAIPLLFYFFRKDKSVAFSKYIGFTKPTSKSLQLAVLTSLLFVIAGISLAFLDKGIKETLLSPQTVTGQLHQMGLSYLSITILLITALFKTSLSEEIFFRGFIGNQVIKKFGFKLGNSIQAVVFGLVHLILFWAFTKAGLFPIFFIFFFSTFAGLTIGYIKEKYAAGSIMPGWLAHGFGNAISYFILAFFITT